MNFFLLTTVFVGAGLLLALLAMKLLQVKNNTAQVGLLILPGILYLLLSGRITEFAGLGISAKFHAASQQEIGNIQVAQDVITNSSLTKADEHDTTFDALRMACKSYVLINPNDMPPKKQNDTSEDKSNLLVKFLDVATVIRSSLSCGKLLAVIFLDQRNKVVGFYEPYQFYDLLSAPAISRQDVAADGFKIEDKNLLMKTRLWQIFENNDFFDPKAEVISQVANDKKVLFISKEMNVIKALNEMRDSNARVALLTEADGEFAGVITRDRIFETLLLALVNNSGN